MAETNYCIPKENIARLKDVVKGLSENGQIGKLVEMTPAERVDVFKQVVSEADAKRLNTRFERAAGQKKLDALKNWVRDNLDDKYRKDEVIFNMKRYKNLEEVNNLIESRMELLAEQKMGIAMTDDQIAKMSKLGESFYKESLALGDNLGKLGFEKENIAWGKAYQAISLYRESLLPQNWWLALVNNLGRAMMLASIKTPFLNIEANIISGFTEAITRRMSSKTLYTPTTRSLSKDYAVFSRKMFKETGVDFTRMITIDDTVTGVGRIVGEESLRVPFAAGQAISDFVFNKTLTTPDVAFASFAFTDSLSLNVTKLAKGDDKLARQLFTDATNVNAQGEAGILRATAIADARYATYTNDSFSAKLSMDLRRNLNKIGGLGDFLMPFVKTPANVAELSVDYAGFGFVKAGFGVSKDLIKSGKVDKETMRNAFRQVARAGVGMTAGYLMAQQFEVEHFMGVYDPGRLKIDQLANVSYNAVLLKTPIGDRWVSVDYLGPLAAPFVSFMYSKKYGTEGYLGGMTAAYLSQLPFLQGQSIFDTLTDLSDPSKQASISSFASDLKTDIGTTMASRMTPGIMYDIARAADDVQRDTKQNKFVVETPLFEMNFDAFVNKIPYLRTELPIKHDVLGRVMLESTAVESMMFGARVRVARDDAITIEVLRLREGGNEPNIKDLRRMNSRLVDALKEKVGDDAFVDLTIKYGKDVADRYEQTMRSAVYKRAGDEEKDKILTKISEDLYTQLLRRNGIK